jgi:hypothetical protein
VVLGKVQKDNWRVCVKSKEVKKNRNILLTIERRDDKRIGHIMCRNGLLKHVIEGKLEGTGRRGRRRDQLPDDLKERRRY